MKYKRVCNEYTFSEKLITFSAKLFFLFLPFIQKTIAHVKCLKERISVFVNFCYGQNVVVKKVVTYFLSKIDDFPFELVCKKRLYCGLTFNSRKEIVDFCKARSMDPWSWFFYFVGSWKGRGHKFYKIMISVIPCFLLSYDKVIFRGFGFTGLFFNF